MAKELIGKLEIKDLLKMTIAIRISLNEFQRNIKNGCIL